MFVFDSAALIRGLCYMLFDSMVITWVCVIISVIWSGVYNRTLIVFFFSSAIWIGSFKFYILVTAIELCPFMRAFSFKIKVTLGILKEKTHILSLFCFEWVQTFYMDKKVYKKSFWWRLTCIEWRSKMHFQTWQKDLTRGLLQNVREQFAGFIKLHLWNSVWRWLLLIFTRSYKFRWLWPIFRELMWPSDKSLGW